MKTLKKIRKLGLLMVMILAYMMCLPVAASGSGLSDDNSLASLGVSNGKVKPEFSYDVWEYEVTVEPGTSELYLDPQTSDPNAKITSITGTVLEGGKATVQINTVSESGSPMTYTLYVTESGKSEKESETQSEKATDKQTETQKKAETQKQSETQKVTEPQTEKQAQTEDQAVQLLQKQVDKLKTNTDLLMKILYGLIALAVILLFIIINLILKNKDLKDDLRDAEDQVAYQTNEFARKEKSLATDNYYAPVQQPNLNDVKPDNKTAGTLQQGPGMEEAFGVKPEVEAEEKKEEPKSEKPKKDSGDKKNVDKDDVDVTMVEL